MKKAGSGEMKLPRADNEAGNSAAVTDVALNFCSPLPAPCSLPIALDDLSAEVQERLAEILEGYLNDLELGLSPNAEELVARHPNLSGPIRAHLAGLDFVFRATAPLRPGGEREPGTPHATAKGNSGGSHGCMVPAAPPETAEAARRQLGDFLIVREIGRGGMGVVYEARQVSLDRRVALKVLPFAAVLDRKQVARFANEAQAAAHLNHPNIVPVFASGCDRGVHYYAMQFIEGQSLDLAIRQLRILAADASGAPKDATTPRQTAAATAGENTTGWNPVSSAAELKGGQFFRTVARLGIEAAEALDYAHQCGVVHRDVKPSNLMLDEQGKLWVSDFGLARFDANASLTATGDVLGTVRYMSPEQVAGKPNLVDPRTDVYSLGITLYELATLHDAFAGADRHAFLRWIAEEEPRPPRQVNPAIPVDLETILLKAIARSAQDRYLTAKELAEDLRRFLQGESILARRASLWDRAGKWARRHRTLVAATAVALVVVLVGSLAATLLIASEHAKTKAALAQAETNFHQAEENLERAETHFRQLREVVDRFGVYHAERLEDLPGAEPLRRELLLDTLSYYREFIRYAGDDPSLQSDLAVTYSKAAGVSEQIGDQAAALAAYCQAVEAFTQLAAAHPVESRYQANLALCQNNLGLLLAATGKTQDAENAYQSALEIQKRLSKEQPDSADFQRDLALTYGNLGLLARTVNQPARAERNYRAAIGIQEQLVAKHADQPEYLHHLAISYNNLSFLQAKSEPVKAEESSRKAREIQERLAAAHPANAEYQSDLALSYNNLGALESYNGRTEQAEESYGRAIAIQQQLVRKSPAVSRFRRDLAVSHNNLGRVFSKSDKKDEAAKSFESARAILKELVDDDPEELSYRSSLGGIYNNLGTTLEELHHPDEAAAMYEQAIREQRYCCDRAPQVAEFREFLERHYANERRVLESAGRWKQYVHIATDEGEWLKSDPEGLYRLAVELVAVAKRGGANQESEACIALAAATLGTAIDAGLPHPERIEDDPALSFLCGHAIFENVRKRIEKVPTDAGSVGK